MNRQWRFFFLLLLGSVFAATAGEASHSAGLAAGDAIPMTVVLQDRPENCANTCNKLVRFQNEYLQLLFVGGRLEKVFILGAEMHSMLAGAELGPNGADELYMGKVTETSGSGRCQRSCVVEINADGLANLLFAYGPNGLVNVSIGSADLSARSIPPWHEKAGSADPDIALLPPEDDTGGGGSLCEPYQHTNCYDTYTGTDGDGNEGYWWYYYDANGCLYRICFDYIDPETGQVVRVCQTNKLC